MIKLIDESNGKRVEISMEVNNAEMILLDLEELFTAFVNAIGLRGFVVEINPEDFGTEEEPPNVLDNVNPPKVH